MFARVIPCSLLVLALAGCGRGDSGLIDVGKAPADTAANSSTHQAALASIAGGYSLTSVGGAALPCCSQDSAGTRITLLSGTLLLDSLPRDSMVFVPSGVMTAKSCVHTIPEGAVVDTGGVVHMPDGSSHVIPKCGAPYTLRLSYRYTAPDGTSSIINKSSGDRYVWGGDSRGTELIRVFKAPFGSDGAITASAAEIQLSVYPLSASAGPFAEPPGPEYHFSRGR